MRIIEFKNTGEEFSAFYAAEQWCYDNGYSYGSMCGSEPIGLLKGDHDIAKWRNLTDKQRKALDGTMTVTGRFRYNDVIITLKK
jgi:hypothetical protein